MIGLTQIALGLFSILGLAIVDASEGTVDWASAGTWLWVGIFAVLVIAGIALALLSRTARGVAPAL